MNIKLMKLFKIFLKKINNTAFSKDQMKNINQ